MTADVWTAPALRISEPPLPATLAIIRAVAPGTVVVVDPTLLPEPPERNHAEIRDEEAVR